MGAAVIIPARLGAERLPNKPLVELGQLPIVVQTWRQANKVPNVEVIVATDSESIHAAIQSAGGRAVMTASSHTSGTDRVAEVARSLGADILVNLQGDEPFIDPRDVAQIVKCLQETDVPMATLCAPIASYEEFMDPNVVKVVTNDVGDAMYFSRSPIPYATSLPKEARRHLGVYGFKRDALFRFCEAPPTDLESEEKLEQLRALDLGLRIRVLQAFTQERGIDTPEDLKRAAARVDALGAEAFPGAA